MLQQTHQQVNNLNKPKQIVIQGSTANAVVYTVPRNKIFKGTSYSDQTTTSYSYLILNGKQISVRNVEPNNYPHNNGQLELFEGDTIGYSNQYGYLVGVEYDA